MQSLGFLPNFDDIPLFEPLAVSAKLSPESINAARVLDNVFDVAKKNINQSDNYLQVDNQSQANLLMNIAKNSCKFFFNLKHMQRVQISDSGGSVCTRIMRECEI